MREAAEREADARELAAINAVVGKASFGKRRETHLRNAAGKDAPTSGTSGDAYPDPDPDSKTQKEDAKTRQARRGEALAPLAVVSLAQWAFHFANTPGAAIGAAASSPPAKTLRAALAAHPAAAMAARRWIRNVSLDLDEGNFFDDDDIGEARVFGVAAVASVLATPDLVGLGSRKDGDARNRDAPATDGALAFVDALGAFAERHSRGDDGDDDDDDGEYGYRAGDDTALRRITRRSATRSPSFSRPPSSTMMTRASTDRVTGIGDPIRESAVRYAKSAVGDARAADAGPRVGARGGRRLLVRARERRAGADAVDDDAALGRSARGTRGTTRRGRRFERRRGRATRRPDPGARAGRRARRRARAAERRRAAPRGARGGGARARPRKPPPRAPRRRRASSSPDAAKLSRDRKTVASARAETELKARRVADEARLHVSKIERERDAMRDKARGRRARRRLGAG